MQPIISNTKVLNGRVAAALGASLIDQAIRARGEAQVILATGASQFEMLSALAAVEYIDWTKVTCYHLDEYIGITDEHPASFKKYLQERFVDQLKVKPKAFNFVDGSNDPNAEVARLNELLKNVQIDVAFVGIGENGHLAFNDPPCNMETADPFTIVTLDEACRKQQLGEGWFENLDAVPKQALSMSMKYILKSTKIVCTVPDERKANAVKAALEGEETVDVPASFLKSHAECYLFMDKAAASKTSL